MADKKDGIYLGSRGADFKSLISNILSKKGKLKQKYVDILTDKESMEIYSAAFTSELVNAEHNYQVLEQKGDVTGNKFIVWYMYRRFPQLDCAEGVKVVARLRINYGAKQSFSEIARQLNFWPYISATNDLRQRKMKPLLEDAFEAFIGATEMILDKRIRVGVGYAIVYDILAHIFDEMDISLRYEDLYDSKTRLKELFDIYETDLGPLVYTEKKNDLVTCCTVFRVQGGSYQEKPDGTINKKRIIGGTYVKIGEGSASLKADAQQNAASAALRTLNRQGWSKTIPKIYQQFGNKDVPEKQVQLTVEEIQKLWGDDINKLQSTKEKTKYQNKYESTPLALYCRKRYKEGIISCIQLDADPNILDSDGMSCLDLIFIGNVDDKLVEDIINILLTNTKSLKMHKQIYQMYYPEYHSPYFKDFNKIDFID